MELGETSIMETFIIQAWKLLAIISFLKFFDFATCNTWKWNTGSRLSDSTNY
jgi:hypothetical protein